MISELPVGLYNSFCRIENSYDEDAAIKKVSTPHSVFLRKQIGSLCLWLVLSPGGHPFSLYPSPR